MTMASVRQPVNFSGTVVILAITPGLVASLCRIALELDLYLFVFSLLIRLISLSFVLVYLISCASYFVARTCGGFVLVHVDPVPSTLLILFWFWFLRSLCYCRFRFIFVPVWSNFRKRLWFQLLFDSTFRNSWFGSHFFQCCVLNF